MVEVIILAIFFLLGYWTASEEWSRWYHKTHNKKGHFPVP